MVIIPAAILCLIPMKNQLIFPLKKMIAITSLALTIVILAGALIASIIHISVNAVLLPLILLLFICYEHMLKSHLFVNASVFLLVMALMSFPPDIAISIDCQIHPLEKCILPLYPRKCHTGCHKSPVFAPIFSRFLSQLIDSIDSPRIWAVTLPVPIIFILLNMLMQPQEYSTMHINRVYSMYLCYIVFAFFCWLSSTVSFTLWQQRSCIMPKTSSKSVFLRCRKVSILHNNVTLQRLPGNAMISINIC